jgi:hypothetical protein
MKNKDDMYKMLKIGFILEYDGFARIIVTQEVKSDIGYRKEEKTRTS